MRKLLTLLLCLLLCSCASNKSFEDELNKVFEDSDILIRQNNYSNYIDYYVPSDIFEVDSGKLTNTYVYNNSKIVMNINISSILNSEYYSDNIIFNEGFFDLDKQVYYHPFEYKDIDDASHKGEYRVYEYGDDYLLYFNSDELIVYSFCNRNDIVPISSRIMLLAKGSTIDSNAIVADFSSKDVIDYQKVQVDLFESVLPVNGRIDDMMLDKQENVEEIGQ